MLRAVAWFGWFCALAVLAWFHRHWLIAHWQVLPASIVLLGLLICVFPLARWLAMERPAAAPKGDEAKERLEVERRKLQNDIRGTFFQAIAGLAVLAGASLAWQQLHVDLHQQQVTNDQVRGQLDLTRQGQIAERFGRAVDQLGSGKTDVVIGGIYGLEQIVKESPTDPDVLQVRPEVFEVLTAYIRVHAPWPPPRNSRYPATMALDKVPPLRIRAPDVQAALRVLWGRSDDIPEGFRIDEPTLHLEKVDLRNATLARLWDGADFSGAELAGTDFSAASLLGAVFTCADLSGADLSEVADIKGATFNRARVDSKTMLPRGFPTTGIVKRRGVAISPMPPQC